MRLPFFPVPAEGETVFSVVGRCAERLGIANHELMSILIGQRYVKTLFSPLPGYLAKIALAMPNGHPWQDISLLIKHHTALPYFTYFHPSDKRQLTFKMLSKAESPRPIIVGMGLTMYRTPPSPKSPRFCLKCINEQIVNYGFAYFLVAHQLPGVSVCWKHDQVLCDGCNNCGRYPLPGKKLTMPGQCLCNSFQPTAVSTHYVTAGAKWLARNSAYLLDSRPPGDAPIDKLRNGVILSGFGKGSLVEYPRLASAIEAQLGLKVLSSINYSVSENGKPSAWLRRYFSHAKTGRKLSTIAGLLILAAAFESIQDFENNITITRNTADSTSVPSEIAPPEKWKLNLQNTLNNYGFRISSCAAALNTTTWKIAATARDQNIHIPLSSHATQRIGIKRLAQIIRQLENGIQKKQIMNDHKVSEWSLLLIELSYPNLSIVRKKKTSDILLQRHRKVITDLLVEIPDATRSDVLKRFPGIYDYMIKKDKAWFQSMIAKTRGQQPDRREPRLDWQDIDYKLSKAITESAKLLLSSDIKLKRITVTTLLSEHGELQRYTTQPARFPMTTEVLNEFVETKEQYLLRKVSWGIKQLIAADLEISINSLRRMCGIPARKLDPYIDEIRSLIYRFGGQVAKRSKLEE
ncbi:hypothetical protein BTA51_23895 [Hahella sp. CCB-MM4]|uniref:TnsD family Tn7-like transposition protein n=1 Tax=Hahella sp. (strain CCB-MM4) TaxID=1926491 RepID=UPI000B9A375F|nr:TnsD family Tn7-like transposition protein [Hahella sp. CCB-MM4]OZG70882.1 hypothetical protein BTA51_23895 [Hahella sp. CCB-MM4]